MVLDDNEVNTTVTALLKSENYVAIGVSTGKEAILILDNTYSLVILDIMMPEKDGICTCIDNLVYGLIDVLLNIIDGHKLEKI